MSTLLQEIKDYTGFGERDSQLLKTLLPFAEPKIEGIAEHFYERILAHPQAHQAITGGEEQVIRLRKTLEDWMRSGLLGPHDEAFYERRARIGRVHVEIGLPQRYMVTAINVMRLDMQNVIDLSWPEDETQRNAVTTAATRLYDIELAIMLETYKEDSEARLRRQERLATIGQLAASIGHDLRNPLSVIESSLYILRRRQIEDERVNRHLGKIAGQVEVCDRIITDLLEMARNRPPKLDSIDVKTFLERAVEAVPVPDNCAIEFHLNEPIELFIDEGLMQQALVNLIINAVQAQQPAGGKIELHAREGDGRIILEIADTGPGFEPSTLRVVFEPLVTTRPSGVGLGLAIVRSVVERHGGQVHAANRDQGGAVVSLHLPSAPADPTS